MAGSMLAGMAASCTYFGQHRIANLLKNGANYTRQQWNQRSSLLGAAAKQHYTVTQCANKTVQMKADTQNFLQHRQRCLNSPKWIDNNAPKITPLPFPTTRRVADRHDLINHENSLLVEKIANTWRTKGGIDCTVPKSYWTSAQRQRLWTAVRQETQNVGFVYYIQKTTPEVPTREACAQDRKMAEKRMKFICHFPLAFLRPNVDHPLPMRNPPPMEPDAPRRKRVFMEFITAQERVLGRMEFELFETEAPRTVANFLAFIRGNAEQYAMTPRSGRKKGHKREHQPLSYRNTPLHRILPGYYCLGGDVVNWNGTGGASIYDRPTFPDEKNELEHIEPGLLCTVGDQPDTCDSKFMITMKALPVLTGTNTVFGRIVKGFDTLWAIGNNGKKSSGIPLVGVYCSDCGEVPLKKRSQPQPRPKSAASKRPETSSASSSASASAPNKQRHVRKRARRFAHQHQRKQPTAQT